jgi:IS605 OrfB family transposase
MAGIPKAQWATAQPGDSTWYAWAKAMDHGLSNKTAHENIQRVREAFRSWQSKGYDGERPTFDTDGRCTFDHEQPRYKEHDGSLYLSLPFAAGRGERELLPLPDSPYVSERVGHIQSGEWSNGRGELLRRGDRYEFHQTVAYDVEVLATPKTSVGVDVGLTNIAVAGAVRDGSRVGAELWSGAEMAEMRQRFNDRRASAQREQRVEAIKDEERRYVNHVCHEISREVVEWAAEQRRPEIVLEDLTDIRETFIRRQREHTPDERRALHSWPFRQLQDYIEYKATEAGIPVRYIDPRDTSRTCAACGHTASENRQQIHFECVECGYQVNADVNAAFNIADLS